MISKFLNPAEDFHFFHLSSVLKTAYTYNFARYTGAKTHFLCVLCALAQQLSQKPNCFLYYCEMVQEQLTYRHNLKF